MKEIDTCGDMKERVTMNGAIVSRGQSYICVGWRSNKQVRSTVCNAVYWKSSIRKAWVTLSQLK